MTLRTLSELATPSKFCVVAGIWPTAAEAWTTGSERSVFGAKAPRRGVGLFSGVSRRPIDENTGVTVRSGRETSFFDDGTTVIRGYESGAAAGGAVSRAPLSS